MGNFFLPLEKLLQWRTRHRHTVEVNTELTIKQQKQREEASNRIRAAMQTKLTKQFKEAKKELRPLNAGQPLVVKQNTKELILKKNTPSFNFNLDSFIIETLKTFYKEILNA